MKIDKLLPWYFENEYKYNHHGWSRAGETISDEIGLELRSFQRTMPLISLELQILLSFMDKKRWALHDLLGIMETGEKDKLLERKSLHGVITDRGVTQGR